MESPADRTSAVSGPGDVPGWMLRRYHRGPTHVLVIGGSSARRAGVARTFHLHGPARGGPLVRVDGRDDDAELRDALSCWLTRRHAAAGPAGLHLAALGTLFVDRIEALAPATQRLMLAVLTATPGPTPDEAPTWTGRLVAGATSRLGAALDRRGVEPALVDALDKLRVEIGPRAQRGAA